MKTKFEVVIAADRDVVWQAFDNPDNMRKWQPTLRSFTHKSGPRGEPGSIAELVYDEDGREVTLTETMTEKRKPDFMAGIYESEFSSALIVNYFQVVDAHHTRWVCHANHGFKGLMKFISIFFRRTICKRTEADMHRFKLLVESEQAEAS